MLCGYYWNPGADVGMYTSGSTEKNHLPVLMASWYVTIFLTFNSINIPSCATPGFFITSINLCCSWCDSCTSTTTYAYYTICVPSLYAFLYTLSLFTYSDCSVFDWSINVWYSGPSSASGAGGSAWVDSNMVAHEVNFATCSSHLLNWYP